MDSGSMLRPFEIEHRELEACAPAPLAAPMAFGGRVIDVIASTTRRSASSARTEEGRHSLQT
jgi:hypothetical protein